MGMERATNCMVSSLGCSRPKKQEGDSGEKDGYVDGFHVA